MGNRSAEGSAEELAEVVRFDLARGDHAVGVGGGNSKRVGGVEDARANAVAQGTMVPGFAAGREYVKAGRKVRLARVVRAGVAEELAGAGLGETERCAGMASATETESRPGKKLG